MLIIPSRFLDKISEDADGNMKGATFLTQSKFNEVFSENNLYFFEEYTDHGVRHINSVLESCSNLITDETLKLLGKEDIVILILGVFLHDLGMHLQPLTFKKMIDGEYDEVLSSDFNDSPWHTLWESYISEAKKFNDSQLINIFGNSNIDIKNPDFNNLGSLTNNERKLIGEFIRRHHPRIASEIVFNGLSSNSGMQLDFFTDFDNDYRLLAGLLARSHGMEIRDAYKVLQKKYFEIAQRPHGIHIIYLMAVLRLADYFQIDTKRILKIPFQTKLFQSPVSFEEHQKHFQVQLKQTAEKDPEELYFLARPISSTYFLALETLFQNIQKELDRSWAVLGEMYGLQPFQKQPKLKYRRIKSNLEDNENYRQQLPYVPEKIIFIVDKEIPKLLVAPLYNNQPSYAVRELLQNAIDACFERDFYETKRNKIYDSKINLQIKREGNIYYFVIEDNGKGMTIDIIKNYFLKVGGSFRKSSYWTDNYTNSNKQSEVIKSGRFGIGVLAAYLLGNEIEVFTKTIENETGYYFKTTLDQNQIEIVKTNQTSPGTKIKISITKNIIDLLKGKKKLEGVFRFNEPILFNKWYVLDTPKITYDIEKEILINSDGITHSFPNPYQNASERWQEIKSNDFQKIYWNYLEECDGNFYCNGFMLQNKYTINGFIAPALLVYDFDGKLPLNLMRTSLTSKCSFFDDLLIDLCKDLVAKLLYHEVNNVFEKIDEKTCFTQFTHPSITISGVHTGNYDLHTLCYTKGGFFPANPVFMKKFNGNLYLTFIQYTDLTFKSESIVIEQLAKVDFISFINLNTSVSMRFITSEFRDLWTNIIGYSKPLITTYKEYDNMGSEYIKKINPLENIGIALEKMHFTEKKMGLSAKLIFDTLQEFLGDDFVIPYKIKDREIKFKKTFQKLAPYMIKYKNEYRGK